MSQSMDDQLHGWSFVLGALVGFLVGMIFVAAIVPANTEMADLAAIRCSIVWHRAHATADTLAAIRRGCAEPVR